MSPFFLHLSEVTVLCSVLHLAAGHGFVHNVVANGEVYPGWNPFVDPCAFDAFGLRVFHVPSVMAIPLSHKLSDHQGPVSTYMTSCDGDCSSFSANPARWFKVDADGYDPSNKQWAAARLIANNFSWVLTIPAGLAPGQYLMRNGIIALHSSEPQFYPSCSQLEITGSGTGAPSDGQLVTMQALYEGVTFPDIYADSVSFTVPGPSSVDFDGQSGSTVAATPKISTTTATSQQTSAPGTSSPGPDNRQCRLASRKLRRRNSA
ncbi:hypothetical protein CVT25_011072 [Psilocybe cyanescens]|uniref:lytic cellulose monooxygenase (C4-dehydrogenating) n=1 Tax=Psilocybe cyanescens TaxID=93625 RepID=A0A409WFE9_PSICY|nr:hypothetical protein CVT25_011072 [Psilocybe cyanescens]